jgi:hypothetical protein
MQPVRQLPGETTLTSMGMLTCSHSGMTVCTLSLVAVHTQGASKPRGG